MNKNRAKRKADRAAAYEMICEGLCIAALFPMTVGFIWLSESLERALLHFAASVMLGLSAAAFHRAADALYTEKVVSNVVSAELIRVPKRLTWCADGFRGVVGTDVRRASGALYGALFKLKDYEETGLSPEEVRALLEEKATH